MLRSTEGGDEIKLAVDEQMKMLDGMSEEEKREYAAQLSGQFGVTLDETILSRLSDADPEVLRNILSSYAASTLVGIKTQMAFVPTVVAALPTAELKIAYITSYYQNYHLSQQRPFLDIFLLN